jgi:hypothetical protein
VKLKHQINQNNPKKEETSEEKYLFREAVEEAKTTRLDVMLVEN